MKKLQMLFVMTKCYRNSLETAKLWRYNEGNHLIYKDKDAYCYFVKEKLKVKIILKFFYLKMTTNKDTTELSYKGC